MDINGAEVDPNSEGVDVVEVKRLGVEANVDGGPKELAVKTGAFGAKRLEEVEVEKRLEDD